MANFCVIEFRYNSRSNYQFYSSTTRKLALGIARQIAYGLAGFNVVPDVRVVSVDTNKRKVRVIWEKKH